MDYKDWQEMTILTLKFNNLSKSGQELILLAIEGLLSRYKGKE